MPPLHRLLHCLPPVLFVAVLGLPAAQMLFGFAPTIGLGGTVAQDPPPAPRTLEAWHDGALQAEVEATLGKQLGLRDWMVRIDNQMKLSLFGVTKRPVVRGPGDWLFEDGYLTARNHLMQRQGADVMSRLYRFVLAQQVLREHGVTLLLLVTPSKNETLREHTPLLEQVVASRKHPSYLDALRDGLALGICNHLDAQQLFDEWHRADPELPIFPRGGVHWSHLGAARIAVRVMDLLEQLSGVDVQNLDLVEAPMGKGVGPSEDDLAQMSNVLDAGRFSDPMPKPVVRPRPGQTAGPQGVLLVSSSFGWLLADYLRDPTVSLPLTMHYYFKSGFDWVGGVRGERREIAFEPAALRAEILRHRFVVIECNSSKVRDLGFGFLEAVLEVFGLPKELKLPPMPPERLARVTDWLTRWV